MPSREGYPGKAYGGSDRVAKPQESPGQVESPSAPKEIAGVEGPKPRRAGK